MPNVAWGWLAEKTLLAGSSVGAWARPTTLHPMTAAVQDTPEEAVSRPVCLAFQLGWDIGRLYQVATIYRPLNYSAGAKLLSQRDFGGTLNTERRLASVSAGLKRLEGAFDTAGLRRPSLGEVLAKYTRGAPKEELREAVYRLQVELLITTQAADPRLGSAYNLGRALADTALGADLKELRRLFNFYRVNGLREELRQLSSSFPPHAAQSVSHSLCIWQCALTPRLKKRASGQGAEQALPRQAEVWRALLSGERAGTDRLQIADYQQAANKLVSNASTVARSVIRRYWLPLLTGLAVAIGGVVLAVKVGGTAAVITGVGAAASALGISWKGVATTLGNLANHLRAPLWGAELDMAIALAITVPETLSAYKELPEERQLCEAARPPRRSRLQRFGHWIKTLGTDK